MIIPRTIKGLSILTASISGLVILALGAAAIFISHREIEAQIDHRIELEMDALLEYHAANGPAALARLVHVRDGGTTNGTGYLDGTGGNGRMMLYALSDASGNRIAGSLIPTLPPSGWTEFLPIRRPDGSTGKAQALSRRLPDGGQIVVAGDRDALSRGRPHLAGGAGRAGRDPADRNHQHHRLRAADPSPAGTDQRNRAGHHRRRLYPPHSR